jgi:hypothetical protein
MAVCVRGAVCFLDGLLSHRPASQLCSTVHNHCSCRLPRHRVLHALAWPLTLMAVSNLPPPTYFLVLRFNTSGQSGQPSLAWGPAPGSSQWVAPQALAQRVVLTPSIITLWGTIGTLMWLLLHWAKGRMQTSCFCVRRACSPACGCTARSILFEPLE